MSRSLRVSANAERQIRKAAAWWQRNRRAAPELFRQEIARGFELIRRDPGIAERFLEVDDREVRRLHLPRIRYFLYYEIGDSETVEVLALWHTSRGTGPSGL